MQDLRQESPVTASRKASGTTVSKLPIPIGDYFHLEGYNFLVMADRFLGWISIYAMGKCKGKCNADRLITCLKSHFSSFGPQMVAPSLRLTNSRSS